MIYNVGYAVYNENNRLATVGVMGENNKVEACITVLEGTVAREAVLAVKQPNQEAAFFCLTFDQLQAFGAACFQLAELLIEEQS